MMPPVSICDRVGESTNIGKKARFTLDGSIGSGSSLAGSSSHSLASSIVFTKAGVG